MAFGLIGAGVTIIRLVQNKIFRSNLWRWLYLQARGS